MTDPIFDCIRAGDASALEALLADDRTHAIARDPRGISALMTALYHRQPSLAASIRRALDASGVDLDTFEAAAIGEVARLRTLVERDPAVLSATSADGFTALHLASFFGHEEASALLLDQGAPVSSPAANPSAVHPLHSAVAARAAGVVARLLASGADVDAAQHGGWTALMAAAMHGDRAIVEMLLAAGADVGLRSDDGQTARDLAEPGVVDLLG
ncbi:MAG: ankyrin repeat domain-containing protein [Planctomycetes bacterium]|nr:ankyrin repeat domain-containing protein [Planctomycetota bacterium]